MDVVAPADSVARFMTCGYCVLIATEFRVAQVALGEGMDLVGDLPECHRVAIERLSLCGRQCGPPPKPEGMFGIPSPSAMRNGMISGASERK